MQSFTKSLSTQGSTVLKALFFILVVYSPFFLHLGDLPLRIWDEARVIANTLEMEKNGNFMVAHFDGKPEMWNTKPPFLLWCQLFFLKIIGNEELSFRLPSAIAGLVTTLTIILFFTRFLKSYWFGMITVLILVTANGYIGDHVVRTADYDAMLTLFMTFYALCFFIYVETGKLQYLHLFFAGLFLAVFTKSVQGTLFLPFLFIYLILSGKLVSILKNKWVYIDFALVIILVSGYYLYRESVNPGYLDAVYINELGGRYLETTEHHQHEFSYYLDLLFSEQFGTWFMFIPLGFIAGLTYPKGRIRNFYIFVSMLILGYFLIISLSETKLSWYTAPLYPLLSVIVALTIYRIYQIILEFKLNRMPYSRYLIPVLFMGFVFFIPYNNILGKVYKPREKPADNDFYYISHLLKEAAYGKTDIKDVFICYDGYNVHLEYYTDLLNQQQKHVYFIRPELLREGYNVIYAQDQVQKKIEEEFFFEETGMYYNVKFIKINGIRSEKD